MSNRFPKDAPYHRVWQVTQRDGNAAHAIDAPLRYLKPSNVRVTVDLFHDDVPDDFIAQVFGVMSACIALGKHATAGHTFQILTKRPDRMRDFMTSVLPESIAYAAARYGGGIDPDGIFDQAMRLWPRLPNVWLGTSAEDQATFDQRVPVLLQTPAAVRWVSLEPMLGAIDPTRCRMQDYETGSRMGYALNTLNGQSISIATPRPWAHGSDRRLGWVVVGGESGPGARPFDIQWARDIIAQCQAAGVPVFVKQDFGPRSGLQGRFTDDEWAIKEYPHAS